MSLKSLANTEAPEAFFKAENVPLKRAHPELHNHDYKTQGRLNQTLKPTEAGPLQLRQGIQFSEDQRPRHQPSASQT